MIELTEKLLEKYFGQDSSNGQTCDCTECTIRNQILDNQTKAIKYDNLMTHTKYHNTFGCQYHFNMKETNRKNQFLQSDNQALSEIVNKLDKELRIRATNYKKFGHHEVYENTMSLYSKIFGREL